MAADIVNNSPDSTLETDAVAPKAEPSVAADARVEELAEIVAAYNDVTQKLQHSHEVLSQEVVRLQEELANKNSQLARSKRLAALGEMAAGIAHEIRNPLGAIRLYADMIVDDLEASGASLESPAAAEDGLLPPMSRLDTAASNSGKIVSAVRGLNAIVNDVLSFARELEPSVKNTDVQAIFERAIDAQRPMIEAAGIDVAVDVELQSVMVDGDLMNQALINLIRNAVDAMSAEGEKLDGGRLTLSAKVSSKSDEHVILRITDTGPGIGEQEIDRLFNPFFTTRKTGTGLGLAIVHRIIDAHGGAITVQNRNLDRDGSTGAIFELLLPVSMETAGEMTCNEAMECGND